MSKNTTELINELEQAKSTKEVAEFLKCNDAEIRRESFGDKVLR